MDGYRNEIEQFIYEICYHPIWNQVASYIYQHPYSLDLSFSRIKYPEAAILEDMILEFASNIRINDDSLLFDANVSCTIALSGEDDRSSYSHDISQWLTVSCEAIVTDKLESFQVDSIRPFNERSRAIPSEQKVSGSIVPIIYKKDLDKVAEEFLSEYYPEALEKPVSVPIDNIAEKMGLKIIQGYRLTDDFSVFGEICFSPGTVQAYDLFKSKTYNLPVQRGTILIDSYTFWERNLGCIKNTIAHEVFHWYRHRIYASIHQILKNETVIACRCPTSAVYPKTGDNWTDEQRMEWQANNMAPRILMPKKTFCQKVDELYASYDYASSPIKPDVLTCIADDLASFYGVSRQSAIIRMIETGHPEASSIYQYDDKNNSDSHSYINQDEAFLEYSNNPRFRKLVDSGLFKYVDGYFVINDEQYLQTDDTGQLALTDRAWSNLSECTLQFSWRYLRDEEKSRWDSLFIFHRANGQQKVSQYENGTNASVIQISKALQAKRAEFEKQNAVSKLTSINKTCWQMIYEIIQAKGLSISHFCELTLLGDEVYRKAVKNIDTNPTKRTIIAICCGLDIDIATTEKLLMLAGHAFSESEEDRALRFCITGFNGQPIEKANEFLESYGFAPLGSQQRL